jgi:hypothetical protein
VQGRAREVFIAVLVTIWVVIQTAHIVIHTLEEPCDLKARQCARASFKVIRSVDSDRKEQKFWRSTPCPTCRYGISFVLAPLSHVAVIECSAPSSSFGGDDNPMILEIYVQTCALQSSRVPNCFREIFIADLEVDYTLSGISPGMNKRQAVLRVPVCQLVLVLNAGS